MGQITNRHITGCVSCMMGLLTLKYCHSTGILITATIYSSSHLCQIQITAVWRMDLLFPQIHNLSVSILMQQQGFTCLDMLLVTHYCWRESEYYSYYLVFKHFPYFSTALFSEKLNTYRRLYKLKFILHLCNWCIWILCLTGGVGGGEMTQQLNATLNHLSWQVHFCAFGAFSPLKDVKIYGIFLSDTISWKWYHCRSRHMPASVFSGVKREGGHLPTCPHADPVLVTLFPDACSWTSIYLGL